MTEFLFETEEEDRDKFEGIPQNRCRRGDIFILGDHRLLCEDSANAYAIDRLLRGERIDLWITDPPYGVGYRGGAKNEREKLTHDDGNMFFLLDTFEAVADRMKPGATFYVWFSLKRCVSVFRALERVGLPVSYVIAWVKNHFVLSWAKYKSQKEECAVGSKDGAPAKWFGPLNETNVWTVKKPLQNKLHPTQKPLELMERAIRNSSEEGDLVFDSFAGSGTTLIACENLHRRCYCVEIQPDYCDIILARWERFTGKKAIKEGAEENEHKEEN